MKHVFVLVSTSEPRSFTSSSFACLTGDLVVSLTAICQAPIRLLPTRPSACSYPPPPPPPPPPPLSAST